MRDIDQFERRDADEVLLAGLGAGGLQLSSAVCRSYWPAALAAAVVSGRCRRAVLVAAVVDAIYEWVTRSRFPDGPANARPIGPVGYVALKRLDDLAYGAGLWTGVVRERTLRPLKPQIKT